MRKLLSITLLGLALGTTNAFVPASAHAGTWDPCSSRFASYFSWCQRPNGIPTEPSVPEPGAAALFALGAALVAARSRGRARTR